MVPADSTGLASFRKKASRADRRSDRDCYTAVMASARQIEANRLNARSSHGPKTDAGKAIASKNALQHGLLSQEVILPGESPSDYAEFAQRLHVELKPIGELESALVGRIGGLLWRLKRVGRLEAGLLMWEHADLKARSWDESIKQCVWIFGDSDMATQGQLFDRGADSFTKLSRYERSIDRNLYKALHEFQRLQAARKSKQMPASMVVDVEVTERSEVGSEKQDPSDE
jgi:hypothetical protein